MNIGNRPTAESRANILKVSCFILFGFAAALFYHHFRFAYKGEGYPANTFLIDPTDIAQDLLMLARRWDTRPYYSDYYSIYFPFASSIIWAFHFLKGAWPYYVYGTVFATGTCLFLR